MTDTGTAVNAESPTAANPKATTVAAFSGATFQRRDCTSVATQRSDSADERAHRPRLAERRRGSNSDRRGEARCEGGKRRGGGGEPPSTGLRREVHAEQRRHQSGEADHWVDRFPVAGDDDDRSDQQQ